MTWVLVWLASLVTTAFGQNASWYGEAQQTASGERFNPHAFTAAHKHLPFNTLVRVTNRLNGKSVVVRINDRGPYVRGRTIDLSTAAADVIGVRSRGVAPVNIKVIGD